jgi:hypothetical protein
MWCIGQITAEYRQRMYALLALYARPIDAREPVVCLDEKSKQLLRDSRPALPIAPGQAPKQDYEYRRCGTCNLFVAVEPQAGRRDVAVTARRTKQDFVAFVRHLVDEVYAAARKVHLVLDNLNTHFASVFVEVLGPAAAKPLLSRIAFHHTPKHASWLNMAELEIGIMEKQCTGRRIATTAQLESEVAAWQHARNRRRQTIAWTFTRREADRKLRRHYVS